MTPEEEAGEFVEEGGFRIDRARALKTLLNHQAADSAKGIYFWVRCAAARRARRIEIRARASELLISFDGDGFSPSELRDPYGGLFGAQSEAGRKQFALGLLWLMRLSPDAVEISSGSGASRSTLLARSLEDETLSRCLDQGTGTSLRAVWPGLLRPFQEQPWRRPLTEIKEMCAMSALELSVSEESPLNERKIFPHEFEEGGVRVRMGPSDSPRSGRSTVFLSVLGVRCGQTDFVPGFMPSASFADGDFSLDASEFSAVQNARLESALARIAREEKNLLSKTLSEFERNQDDHAVAAALLESCWMLLHSPKKDAENELLGRLWNAPLLKDERGEAKNLRDAVLDKMAGFEHWPLEVREKNKIASLRNRASPVP